MKLRIGTRGSRLARIQAGTAAARLARLGHETEIVPIATAGDRSSAPTFAAIGPQGVFVREIEQALLDGAIDVAVHSHKDLPTISPDDLAVAAVPERRDPHSRIEDWIANLPESGFREMCSWERFCAFAREPERRTVGSDAHISIQGVRYEVDSELAGEEVVLWWGLFDHELFVEWRDKRFGPYRPSGGPVPLHRYRKRRKSAREKRAETVAALAAQLSNPRAAVSGNTELGPSADIVALPRRPFIDLDPWGEIAYRDELEARRGIADRIGKPLGALDAEALEFIAQLLQRTLDKTEIARAIAERFLLRPKGTNEC